MVLRWVEIMMKFHKEDKEWVNLVKKEQEICPWIFKFLFDEVPKVLRPQAGSNDHVQGNANRICESLMICLMDWPDLFLSIHTELRTSRDPMLEVQILRMCQSARPTREGKHQRGELAGVLLEKARRTLAAGGYDEAVLQLTLAAKSICEAMRPDMRWYVNGWFQIMSNRALAAERRGDWNLCRHDTRLTIFMRNDHIKSYQRLPLIAQAFQATLLKRELEDFVAQLNAHPPKNSGEWRTVARSAVAMISITAIMESLGGHWTPELRAELEKVGIDDMFTSVTLADDVLEYLPWTNPTDLV
jgi:hypothetical protein